MDRGISIEGGGTAALVVPEAGGRLGQLWFDGRPVLRGPELAGEGWAAWGSYPLLPWSNRIPGGRFSFRGHDHEVPVNWDDGSALHGLVAATPWSVTTQTATTVDLEVDAAVGPFVVRGRQRFAIDAGGLAQRIEVTNLGTGPLPFGLGIHPWFVGGPIRVPAERYWPGPTPIPDGPSRPVTPDVDLRRPRVAPLMDRCYTGLTASSVDAGGVTLSWDGPVTQVVVFTGVEGWVCVEPVTMANDGFRMLAAGEEGHGVLVLDPAESLRVDYWFERGR